MKNRCSHIRTLFGLHFRNVDEISYVVRTEEGEVMLITMFTSRQGKGRIVLSPAIEARTKTGLSQSQFAALLGVSVRTLQGWEQGRKQPSGAARTLLAIARTNLKAVLAVSKQQMTDAE